MRNGNCGLIRCGICEGIRPSHASGGSVKYDVRAKRDVLAVDFVPSDREGVTAEDVWLTGPAAFVAEILPLSDRSLQMYHYL